LLRNSQASEIFTSQQQFDAQPNRLMHEPELQFKKQLTSKVKMSSSINLDRYLICATAKHFERVIWSNPADCFCPNRINHFKALAALMAT